MKAIGPVIQLSSQPLRRELDLFRDDCGNAAVNSSRLIKARIRTGPSRYLASSIANSLLPAEEFACPFSDGFPEDIEHRDQEQSDTARRDHADEDRRADGLPRNLRRAARPDQRHQPENEGNGGHEHRPKSHLGAESCGIFKAQPLLALFLGELDDQDGVLRRQRNQNDEPDLRIEIEREVARSARRRSRRSRQPPRKTAPELG